MTNKLFWIDENRLAGRCGPGVVPFDLASIEDAGFRYLLSLDRDEFEKIGRNSEGIDHRLIAMPNSIPPQPDEVELFRTRLPEAIAQVLSWLEKNDGAVLIHCHAGNDRTGGVLTGVLMQTRGLNATEALGEVRKANPEAISAFGYEEMFMELLASGETL